MFFIIYSLLDMGTNKIWIVIFIENFWFVEYSSLCICQFRRAKQIWRDKYWPVSYFSHRQRGKARLSEWQLSFQQPSLSSVPVHLPNSHKMSKKNSKFVVCGSSTNQDKLPFWWFIPISSNQFTPYSHKHDSRWPPNDYFMTVYPCHKTLSQSPFCFSTSHGMSLHV